MRIFGTLLYLLSFITIALFTSQLASAIEFVCEKELKPAESQKDFNANKYCHEKYTAKIGSKCKIEKFDIPKGYKLAEVNLKNFCVPKKMDCETHNVNQFHKGVEVLNAEGQRYKCLGKTKNEGCVINKGVYFCKINSARGCKAYSYLVKPAEKVYPRAGQKSSRWVMATCEGQKYAIDKTEVLIKTDPRAPALSDFHVRTQPNR